jgi:hypothetical protein
VIVIGMLRCDCDTLKRIVMGLDDGEILVRIVDGFLTYPPPQA